ncbi:TRAP transporter substrate-binding protein [Okeania sp. KiyG1]|uniref:TRAP transporter substrate-binding protein n=1 Tax=Okeania sp. KiyG1 TaxID=2720165 RepID=UPI001920C6B9|nr:ABC transporter substrate-binding protein [Okeania sp. KiyG1]GGA02897.1 ABC transporter substrate-binding protein [Okeania sp. KiyG1]
MKRRKFFYNSAIGIASSTALVSCHDVINQTQPNIKWRMATSWDEKQVYYEAAKIVCQRVEKMTNGRFVITPYPAKKIVEPLEVLNAVKNRTVECGHTSSFYYMDQNPALAFGTGVPFGLNIQQQNAWLFEGGGLEAMQKIYADFNIINFPASYTGVQMGGWFKKQINIKDMEGLRMRIPGLGAEVMKQFGVKVRKDIAGVDIQKAMKNNEIDAAKWSGPYEDKKLGLNEAASYYYYPGWWEPGSSDDVLVNLDKWNELPGEYQEIFKVACFEASLKTIAKQDSSNQSALQELRNENDDNKKINLISYEKSILNEFERKAFEIYKDYADQDKTFKDVYTKWKTFRNQIYRWYGAAELEFSKFSFKL